MPFPSEQYVRSPSPYEVSSSPGKINKDWRNTSDGTLTEKPLLPSSGTREKVLYAVAVVCESKELTKNRFSPPSSGLSLSSPALYPRNSLRSTKSGSAFSTAVRISEPADSGRSAWLSAAQSVTRSSTQNELENSALCFRKQSSVWSSTGGGREGERTAVVLPTAARNRKSFMIVDICQPALYSLESVHQRDRQFLVGERSEEEKREAKEYDDNRIYVPYPASVQSCLAELNAYISKDDASTSADSTSRSLVQKPVHGCSPSSSSRGGGGAGRNLRRGSETIRWSDRFLHSANSLHSSLQHVSTSPYLVPRSPPSAAPSRSSPNGCISSPSSVKDVAKGSSTPQRHARVVSSGKSNRSLFPPMDVPLPSSERMEKKRAEPLSLESSSTPSFTSTRNPATSTVKKVSKTVRVTSMATSASHCSPPPSHSPSLSCPHCASTSKDKQWTETHYFQSTNLSYSPSTQYNSHSGDSPFHLSAVLPSGENSYLSGSVDKRNANGSHSSSLGTGQEPHASASTVQTSYPTPRCPVIVAVKEDASLAPRTDESDGGPQPSLVSPLRPPKNIISSSRRVSSAGLPPTSSLSTALTSSPSTSTEENSTSFVLLSSYRPTHESASRAGSPATFPKKEEAQEKCTPPLISEETASIASPRESMGLSSLLKPAETSDDDKEENSGEALWLHAGQRNSSSWNLTVEQDGNAGSSTSDLQEGLRNTGNEKSTTVTTMSERPPTSPVMHLVPTSARKMDTPLVENSMVGKVEEMPLILPIFPSVGSSILLPPKWQFTQSTQGQRYLRRDSEGSKCGESILNNDDQQQRRRGSNENLPNRLRKKVAGNAEQNPIRVSISEEVEEIRGREKEEDLKNRRVDSTVGPSFPSFPSYPSPPDGKSLVTHLSTHFSSRVPNDFKKFASSNTSLSFFPSSSTHKRGLLADGIRRDSSCERFSSGVDGPFFPGRSTHRRPSYNGSAMSSSSGAPDSRSPSTRVPAVLHRDWRGITYLSCDRDDKTEFEEKEK